MHKVIKNKKYYKYTCILTGFAKDFKVFHYLPPNSND
jgi:hypothetical protein